MAEHICQLGGLAALDHVSDLLRRKQMRGITPFHALLNKKGLRFSLIVGAPIDPGGLPDDAGEATEALKRYVERVLPTDQTSRPT